MPDFERPPLHQMTRKLAATAMGRLPATLVVRGGTLVSVTSGEILPNMSVAVQGSRIAYIGPDASHTVGDGTRVIEAGRRYIAPGFLDGHCHVETKAGWAEPPVEDGLVRLDPEQNVARICVIERHGKSGEHLTGFVAGLGFDRPAALATTVAHDSHNLMVMGNSEEMMVRAARAVADEGGGVAVATREELTLLPLPVAGLMSPEPYEEVAERSKAIGEVLVRAGCRLNNAFMTLSFLALVVHPELHVSDKGLVGVGEQGSRFVEVIEQG